MAITKVHPDMISPTVVKTTDKASNAGGGTEGQVVQLTDANKIHTVYLDVGTTDGKIVQAGGSDKIATSLIDTGLTDGKVVKMTTGDKLPAVNGSLLTSIVQALPVGMPLQIQSTQTTAKITTGLDTNVGSFYESGIAGLLQTIVPLRESSKFKIDVTWSGGLDDGTDPATSDWLFIRDLGFYLKMVVDVGEADTASDLTGAAASNRMLIIAPVSINNASTNKDTQAALLFSCSFTYIAAPTYDAGETLSFQLAARINVASQDLITNSSVVDTDSDTFHRAVSSITVTEIRGA